MKKFLKALAVLAAVAALGFGFASCSDDDDDSGSGSSSGSGALAAFSHENTEQGMIDTIYFYSDNTWKNESVITSMNNYTEWDMSGTYALTSGDFTNGTLDFTVVKRDGNEKGWEKVSLEIKDGVFYLKVWSTPAEVDVSDTADKYVKK